MHYFVQRDGRDYGPYTEADLRRYLASGQLSPQDRFRAEAQGEYRLLGNSSIVAGTSRIPSGAFPPAYQRPCMANGAPLPPNLHWGLVLMLSIVTCGFFAIIWMLMQAWWLKQLRAENRAIWILAASFASSYVGSIIAGVVSSLVQAPLSNDELHLEQALALSVVPVLMALAGWGLFIAAELEMRKEMLAYFNTAENIHLRLNLLYTLLGGMYYFQYHMSRIAEWKKAGGHAA